MTSYLPYFTPLMHFVGDVKYGATPVLGNLLKLSNKFKTIV